MTEPNERVRGVRPPRATPRGNGQWNIDGLEPLNGNETWKQKDGGLNVRDRIERVYAQGGFASIDPTDLHGRFRWWGLYTQRRPGIDGGKTALLDDSELEDEYFMMRVRLDGGQLTVRQLRAIGAISAEFARDTADITDRQNIQLHWIRVEDVPEIWRRLEAVGLTTAEACGDVPRVILGSPLAGIAADELLDPTQAIRGITQRYIGDPTLANLPRKYKTAITGHPAQDVVHEINDCAFVAVRHPELGLGYDLWVGGGLSTAARFADRVGVFVYPERVVEVWHAVTKIFRDYGYRRLRNKARMKFLLADWGPAKFRTILESEYLETPLPDGPPPPAPTGSGDHIGVHRQKDGRYYIGVAPMVGRVSGTLLLRIANVLETHGSDRLRTTPFQKLVLLDIAEDQLESCTRELDALGLPSRPSLFRRGTIACTGIQFCKLAIVETKDTATDAVHALERRLADLEADLPNPLTLHVNGCPNSCARIQTADIGLKGQLLPDGAGGQTPGFQVHLGGGLASTGRGDNELGRTVRGLKVTADDLADYVERLVRRFAADRGDAESFAQWAHRVDETDLR